MSSRTHHPTRFPFALLLAGGLLAGCQDTAVIEPNLRGADPAGLSMSTSSGASGEQIRANRLRELGRPGLQKGVNLPSDVPIPADALAQVQAQRPTGFTQPAHAPTFEPKNVRLGEAARPSANLLQQLRASNALKSGQLSSGGEIGTQSTTQSSSSMGPIYIDWYSYVDPLFGGDLIDFGSGSGASEPITYIEVLGDSYIDGYPALTLYDYWNNSSFAGVGWRYDAYLYGYAGLYEQYGYHYWYHEFSTGPQEAAASSYTYSFGF